MDANKAAVLLLLLTLLPGAARAALVNVITAPKPLVVAEPCAEAGDAVIALESSVVEERARTWAYLMHTPGFSAVRMARRPGEEFSVAHVRDAFYRRLAYWEAQNEVPLPSSEELSLLNDTALHERLVADVCR